jgi:N-acetyl-S-(2-succino)cysteine monooxygenase
MAIKRKLKLGVFLLPDGHHPAAWRHPSSRTRGGPDFQQYVQMARTAQRGKFDSIFLADGLAIRGRSADLLSRGAQGIGFEPLTLLSALAPLTENIGLVATASTTFNEPYNIARKFASLDHLSGGRAAWNVVTSSSDAEAQNFNGDKILEHALRYERAGEFVDVVTGLWDSWTDDCFVAPNKQSGVYFDPAHLHVLNHKNKYFSVVGPLNVARPPQGYPVIVQAGSSEAGRELAARTAEMIYEPAQTLAAAQAFYADVKSRMAKYGRRPEHLVITPGLYPVVGRTEQEAKEKYEELQALLDPKVGVAYLSNFLGGADLSGYPIDGPLPELADTNAGKGRFKAVVELAQRENLTIQQLYLRFAVVRGHRLVLGTPSSIADQLEDWFIHDAADGYNLVPPHLPSGLDDFVDLVVPELQRRGLFRTEYEGRTMRENLGLPRPSNRFGALSASA